MSKWVGYAVSVNCGEPLGCYQGTILEADGSTVTLTKAFRNGFPYPKSQVTLNAVDIKELKIIEGAPEPAEPPRSTVAVAKGKKGARVTVCEDLQANHGAGNGAAGAGGKQARAGPAAGAGAGGPAPRSKPIDIQPPRPAPHKNPPHSGSFGAAGSTPKGRGGGGGSGGGGGGGGGGLEKARRRNEACFGSGAAGALDDDFDFEGNLALFDKRALWQQMRAARPDLLRSADDKFRHDENVLGGAGAGAGAGGALVAPAALRGARAYVTDAGAAVGSVSARARRLLWAALARRGLAAWSRALLARAGADVALRLVGGGRRLEARNAHQAPRVVALCAAHAHGAAGLAAARLLASHGARAAALLLPAPARACAELARELAAAALGEVALAAELAALPSPDLVLLALHDPQLDEPQEDYEEALSWARASRAALVALEPPPSGWAGVSARACVLGLAPCDLPPELGRVYLADVAPPARVFAELGIVYRPPFGAESLLALHPADD